MIDQLSFAVSVIIPTYNRLKTLKRLLDILGHQSYSMHLIEVIVVADGCSDSTVEMLKTYRADYSLQFIEQFGQGPAAARNKAVLSASGELLIFLDDDIEPSEGLIEAHVKAHRQANRVAIGYLPFTLQKAAGFFNIKLWTWWEDKFRSMLDSGYRFSYEDLLSGNFSIMRSLFKKLGEFNCTLDCREDYEFGIRLMKSDVEFVFANEAWGYHNDETTDIKRSLKRKRHEGRSDVQISRLHPSITTNLRFTYLNLPQTSSNNFFTFLAFNAPRLSDFFAIQMLHLLKLYELSKSRSSWDKLNFKLHKYWYLRGVIDELHTKKNVSKYLKQTIGNFVQKEKFDLDLKDGIAEAERILDERRPYSVRLFYNNQFVGDILDKAGAERLRGAHLRPILATKLSWSLMQVLALNQASE